MSLRLTSVLLPLVLAACTTALEATTTVASNDASILAGPGEEVDRDGQTLLVGRSVYGKYLAARHAEVVGDYEMAAGLMVDVANAMPAHEDILRRVHLLLVSGGQMADAREFAERVVAQLPQAPFANLTLATAELRAGEFAAAATRLGEMELSGPNRLVVPLLSAWAQAGAGDVQAALDQLESLGDSQAFGVIEGLHRGLIADLGNQPETSEDAFVRTIEASETTPLRVVEAYASLLSRQGRWDDAGALIDDFLSELPDSILIEPVVAVLTERRALAPIVSGPVEGAAEALSGVARALSRENGSLTALLLLRLSLDLRPDDPSAQLLLGQLLLGQDQPEQALAAYNSVPADTPFGWLARLARAQVLEQNHRIDEAVALLSEMIAERPERSDAAHSLGDLLRVNERFGEAVAAYDNAVERVGEIDQRHWRLLYTRGIALERSKQWPRAEADFLSALDLQQDQPHVLNYLGYSWVEQGINLTRARQMIEKAVEQRPRDGFIADSMGWVLYRMGEFAPAVGHLETAVALEPSDPIINDHLGDAYWLVGRREEAEFQWRRALASDPEEALAEEILAKLRGDKSPQPLPPGADRDS